MAGEDGHVWSYGTAWPEKSHSSGEESRPRTIFRERHLRYYSTRCFRSAARNRRDLQGRGTLATRWRSYKCESDEIENRHNLIRELLQACLGGSLLLSRRYQHRLRGIELFVIIFSISAVEKRKSDSRESIIVQDWDSDYSQWSVCEQSLRQSWKIVTSSDLLQALNEHRSTKCYATSASLKKWHYKDFPLCDVKSTLTWKGRWAWTGEFLWSIL